MDIHAGFIADPVIAPSGKVFSASGLSRLAEAICSLRIDNGCLLWRRYECHDKQRKEKATQTK